ncbi:MAG: hypothetical protein ACOYO1_06820 [Bacteroidales bacterium]
MKILKTLIILAFIAVNFSTIAQQTDKIQKTPEERVKRQLKAINKECSLSDEQSVKVEGILLNSQNKLAELKMSKPTQKGEKLKQIKEINDNQTDEIAKVLNSEQLIKYKDLVEKQKEKIRNKMIEKRAEKTDMTE